MSWSRGELIGLAFICSPLALVSCHGCHGLSTARHSPSAVASAAAPAKPAMPAVSFGPRRFAGEATARLAENGRALLQIRVPKRFTLPTGTLSSSATEAQRRDYALAASLGDLRRVLKQMTGAEFELLRTDDLTSGIVVGTASDFSAQRSSELESALKVGPDGSDGREAFYIKTEPRRIVIAANNGYGMGHGIQRLLTTLGYRHFFQGKTWEIIPRKPNLSVALHLGDRPAFYVRNVAPLGGDAYFATPTVSADRAEWQRSLLLDGTSLNLNATHAWQGLPKIEVAQGKARDIFNAHPEYVLGFGKSRARSGAPFSPAVLEARGGSDYKFDVSNPKVRELFLEGARQRMRASNAAANEEIPVPIGPSDGAGWYLEDLASPDWYRQLGYPAPRWTGSVSDHVFGLANFIADHISREFPDKNPRICLLAYDAYHAPPGFELHRNVSVSVVQGSCGSADCGMRSLALWKNLVTEPLLASSVYLSVWVWTRGEPPASTPASERALRELLWSDLYQNGVRALNAEAHADMALNGLGYYLFAQGVWNPLADFKALREDFLQQSFGAAAREMDRYYETLEPADVTLPSHSTWARAVTLLDQAARTARANKDAASESRINEIKSYWYYTYLKRRLELTPEDAGLRERFLELFFRQGPSYAISFDGFGHELIKRFNAWQRGLTPLPYRGSLAESGCPKAADGSYKPCSRPGWLAERYGFRQQEVDAWWREVLAYYTPVDVERRNFTLELVPTSEARTLHPGQCFDSGASFSARSSLDAWVYSFHGEPVELKLFSLSDPADVVHFTYSVLARDGAVLLKKDWSDHARAQPILVQSEVKSAGAYRIHVEHDISSFKVKPAPGYPIAFEPAPSAPARIRRWTSPRAVFYVPAATSSLDLDVLTPARALRALSPNGSEQPVSPLSGNLAYGAVAKLPVAPGSSGFWQLALSAPSAIDSLQLFNAPNHLANAEGYLLVPRDVATQDRLTGQERPYPVDRLEIGIESDTPGSASKFSGTYQEVSRGPGIPREFLPTTSPGWDPAWEGSKQELAIFRHVANAGLYLMRTPAAPKRGSGFLNEELGAGWFVLFDASEPGGKHYMARANTSADLIVYRGAPRTFLEAGPEWQPSAWREARVKLVHLPCE